MFGYVVTTRASTYVMKKQFSLLPNVAVDILFCWWLADPRMHCWTLPGAFAVNAMLLSTLARRL